MTFSEWGHLGTRLDALADDQVAPEERDRLLAHAVRCPSCRTELRAAREVKARLRRLGEPDVPGDLTARLLSLPGASPSMPLAASDARERLAHDPYGLRHQTQPTQHPGPDGRDGPDGSLSVFGLPVARSRRQLGGVASVGLLVGAALLAGVPAGDAGRAGPSAAIGPRGAGDLGSVSGPAGQLRSGSAESPTAPPSTARVLGSPASLSGDPELQPRRRAAQRPRGSSALARRAAMVQASALLATARIDDAALVASWRQPSPRALPPLLSAALHR